MKKVIFHIKLAVIATVFLASCVTREWDPAEDISGLAETWARWYVDDALDYAVDRYDTLGYYSDWKTFITSSLKDTLSIDIICCYNKDDSDSVNVTTTLRQVKDSIIVTTDGYRYSDKFWVHIYTVDPGIVNYEGNFHVDFYETGKNTPWAWSEIKYNGVKNSSYSRSYSKSETITGWY